MIKIIHTGDVHLGAKFTSFKDKAGKQRRALLDSFRKVVDTAILERANILLIAGDLFDSNFPSYDTVNAVKTELKKLNDSKIYVAISPGTHDCLSVDSIYRREDFTEGLPYIYVFDDEKVTEKKYPDLDLTVYAQANTSNKSKKSPIGFLEAIEEKNSKYKVAMAHGSLQIEGKFADDDWPISLTEISKSGMDYIALGHWHGAQDFSFGATKAWYSGSPEITYKEGKGGLGQGFAIKIEFLNNIEITPIKISDKKVEEFDLDVSGYSNIDDIYKEIEKKAGENTILILNIKGVINPELFLSTEKIEEDFKDRFFSIKAKNTSQVRMDDITKRDYPEEIVIGKFIRIMQEKINSAGSDEEKNILEEALQLGVAELEGKEVI